MGRLRENSRETANIGFYRVVPKSGRTAPLAVTTGTHTCTRFQCSGCESPAPTCLRRNAAAAPRQRQRRLLHHPPRHCRRLLPWPRAHLRPFGPAPLPLPPPPPRRLPIIHSPRSVRLPPPRLHPPLRQLWRDPSRRPPPPPRLPRSPWSGNRRLLDSRWARRLLLQRLRQARLRPHQRCPHMDPRP
jgi:hypothetical protein